MSWLANFLPGISVPGKAIAREAQLKKENNSFLKDIVFVLIELNSESLF